MHSLFLILVTVFLAWGSRIINGHKLHLLQKKALRAITNSDFIAHTEPICKQFRLLKVTDMFQLGLWKFYFKLMNNMLPTYFDSMKPTLPNICLTYEIRKPVFHPPAIKHTFAEQLVQYNLIKLLNKEADAISITSKVHTHSFFGYKLYVKNKIIGLYSEYCNIVYCESCRRLNRE